MSEVVKNSLIVLKKSISFFPELMTGEKCQITIHEYSTDRPEIKDSLTRAIIVPGLGQMPEDDPLPFIATAAAEVIGGSFVVSWPPFQSDYLKTPQGQHQAFSQTVDHLVNTHNLNAVIVIGYSTGGTRALNILGSLKHNFPPINGFLCLGSPESSRISKIGYFYSKIKDFPEGDLLVGKRQILIPEEQELNFGEEFNSSRAKKNLKERQIPLVAVSIKGDRVVKRKERMSGTGVKHKTVRLSSKGLTPSQIHNWVGKQNRAKLKQIVRRFIYRHN